MADIAKLKTLLASPHPVSGAWEVDDAAAAAQGNVVDSEENIDSLSGNQMFTSTDDTEFAGLSDAKRQMWVSWCNVDRDPFDDANVDFVIYIFTAGSTTVTNLAAIRKRDVSLFALENIGVVYASHVTQARAYHV